MIFKTLRAFALYPRTHWARVYGGGAKDRLQRVTASRIAALSVEVLEPKMIKVSPVQIAMLSDVGKP